MSAPLPEPTAEALEHSRRLSNRIAGEIMAAGGWIPFSRFMQLALYEPGLGYYAAGAAKLGAGGDFVTAPEITPLFAQSLAVQFAAILARSGGDILELGAGSGRLATDVLDELDRLGALPDRYLVLEVGSDLRLRQQEQMFARNGRWLERVQWLDALPDRMTGVVFANEVLDAVPCEIVCRRADRWRVRGVTTGGAAPFEWSERALPDDDPLARLADERLPPIEGYASELAPASEALVRTLVERLAVGGLLLIDYGFPAAEYYHPQRSAGTLMCHYRHHAHPDPLWRPGLQDITAHVDFSAVASAAELAGGRIAGYASLSSVLVDLGVVDRLRECAEPGTVDYLRCVAPLQKLLSAAEMGELFKAIGIGKRLDLDWDAFRSGDRAHRL